jgi:hypothetical protein
VDDALLKATELRLAGNAAARGGDFRRAEALYSQGLELQAREGRAGQGILCNVGAAILRCRAAQAGQSTNGRLPPLLTWVLTKS